MELQVQVRTPFRLGRFWSSHCSKVAQLWHDRVLTLAFVQRTKKNTAWIAIAKTRDSTTTTFVRIGCLVFWYTPVKAEVFQQHELGPLGHSSAQSASCMPFESQSRAASRGSLKSWAALLLNLDLPLGRVTVLVTRQFGLINDTVSEIFCQYYLV